MWPASLRAAIAALLSIMVTVAPVSAEATLTVKAAVGAAPTEGTYVNFDAVSLGNATANSAGVSVVFGGDAGAVKGSLTGKYAAPYLSGGNGSRFGDLTDGADRTAYLSTGTGSITLGLPSSETDVGLLWGSVDAFNTLDLYAGPTLVGSITGRDVDPSANGDQGIEGTFYVNIHSTLTFDRIVALSSQYAFELDNLAFDDPAPVPEPATMALLIIGIIGLGCTRRSLTLRATGLDTVNRQRKSLDRPTIALRDCTAA